MSADRWNEALEAAAKACEKLADKYRLSTAHRTDDLVAAAMMCSQAILALREADPAHPSAKPFKCPHCGSHFFGPTWRGKELAGRYCKGWPSDEDRSYRQCPAKYVEWYGQAEDQRGAAARELPAANSARCDEGNPSSAGTPSLLTSAKQPAQSAPHHPGVQEKAAPALPGRAMSREEFLLEVGGKPFESWAIAEIRQMWLIAMAAAEEERSRG